MEQRPELNQILGRSPPENPQLSPVSWTTRYPWLHFPWQVVANACHRNSLQRYQQRRLQQLLQHAAKHVPFYARRQLPPDTRELHQWPIVTKGRPATIPESVVESGPFIYVLSRKGYDLRHFAQEH